MRIQGRTFVVSGGASGLGKATALMIYKNGGNVVILDMNNDLGEELIKDLGPSRSLFVTADVSDSESIANAVSRSLKWISSTGYELGGVVAAAGVGNPAKILNSDGETFDMDGFEFVMSINVRGSVDLIRQFLPYLSTVIPEEGERGVLIRESLLRRKLDREERRGRTTVEAAPTSIESITSIPVVSSSAAFDGQPGQVSYAASKGAIASLTLPLTRDLARYGIRVVCLAPGLFDSGMTSLLSDKVRKSLTSVMEFPLRPGQPNEFASLAKQSIENCMLNGTVLRIDGGLRLPSKM